MKYTISHNNQINTKLPGNEVLHFQSNSETVEKDFFYSSVRKELLKLAKGRFSQETIDETMDKCKNYLEAYKPVTIGETVFQKKKD